jgi:hypothetical protein
MPVVVSLANARGHYLLGCSRATPPSANDRLRAERERVVAVATVGQGLPLHNLANLTASQHGASAPKNSNSIQPGPRHAPTYTRGWLMHAHHTASLILAIYLLVEQFNLLGFLSLTKAFLNAARLTFVF